MIHLSKECFRFYIGDESRVVIEDAHKRDNSIFSEVYSKAFKVLNDLLPLLEMDKKKNVRDEDQESPCPSNIFAFIGDRGAGKTSCMKSVAEMLRTNDSVHELDVAYANFKKKKFEVLESTDPSFFSENKNILEIFIGRLFSRFRNYVEKSERGKESEKNQVYQLFERVKQSLVCMEKKCIEEDDCAEQLIGLSASVELQDNIQNLINKFLNYIGKDFLVIPIDDLDLHTIHAFNMAEQIRKYLTQKNTIILMALKIEQLEYAVERHYLRHYQLMLEKSFINADKLRDMAFKYMVKLIPQEQRFPLKSIEEIIYGNVEIVENNKTRFQGSLKEHISSLMYKGTGYYFEDILPIIPKTLREFRHFILFLYDMSKNEETLYIPYNKKRFKQYLIELIKIFGNEESKDQLKMIDVHSYAQSMNKTVVQFLAKSFYKRDDSDDVDFPDEKEIRQIINNENLKENISVGDVLALIHHIELKESDERVRSFLWVLKFFYSMMLSKDHVMFSNGATCKNDYRDFVGFGLINPNDVMNQVRSMNVRFDYKIINLEEILNKYTDESKNTVLAEFFVLSLYREYISPDDNRFRRDTRTSNKVSISSKSIYMYFNVFSIFSNLLDIDNCYKKFAPSLWKKVKNNNNSLYSAIGNLRIELKSTELLEKILLCTNEIDIDNVDDFDDNQQSDYEKNESNDLSTNAYKKIKTIYEKFIAKLSVLNIDYQPLKKIYDMIFDGDKFKEEISEILSSVQRRKDEVIKKVEEFLQSNEETFLKGLTTDYFSMYTLVQDLNKFLEENTNDTITFPAPPNGRFARSAEGYRRATHMIMNDFKNQPVID